MDGPSRTAWGCLAIVGILTVFAVLASCVGLPYIGLQALSRNLTPLPTLTPHGGYTVAALQQLPETQLVYPNAEVFRTDASERGAGLAKGWYAAVGFSAGTQATWPEVERWYAQQLQAGGWTRRPPVVYTGPTRQGTPLRTPVPEVIVVWQRGDLAFQLTFHRTAPLSTSPVPIYPTYFSVTTDARR